MKSLMGIEEKIFPLITAVGDSAVLIEFDQKISHETNCRVHELDQRMEEELLAGVLERVPAYASLLVLFDPLLVRTKDVKTWIKKCVSREPGKWKESENEISIHVYYGGEHGPDLDYVAQYHQITPAEVVERHTAQVYRVGMMGFTPGFPYLLGLDKRLATPRLETPRTFVPAGSVGIAGEQTGVYPLDSPGGWRIIGRTEVKLFNPDNPPHFLLSPGDSVRFIPINKE